MTDKLPPEVAEALAVCDRDLPMHMDGMPSAWQVVRAALLRSTDQKLALEADIERLTDENARLRERNAALESLATRDHDWITDLLDTSGKAEAERDALRKRITDAPTCTLQRGDHILPVSGPLRHGQTVALVVLDDDATGEHADSIEAWASRKVATHD